MKTLYQLSKFQTQLRVGELSLIKTTIANDTIIGIVFHPSLSLRKAVVGRICDFEETLTMIFRNTLIASEIKELHGLPGTLVHRVSSDGARKGSHLPFVALSWTMLNMVYHTEQPFFNWIWAIYKVSIYKH